jgi:hypothetical protein
LLVLVTIEPHADFSKITRQTRIENVLRRHSFETFIGTFTHFSGLATVVGHMRQQHGDGIQAARVFAAWPSKGFETLRGERKVPHYVCHTSSLRAMLLHDHPLTLFQTSLPQVGILDVLRINSNNL